MKKLIVPFMVSVVFILTTFLAFGQIESYFADLLDKLVHNHVLFSLASFLVLASDILLPVPSSLVMFTNGFVLDIAAGSFVSLLGLQVGATIGYYIGKAGVKWNSKGNDQVAHLFLAKYGPWTILLSRGIPVLSESVCIVCGFNKMPFKRYFVLNFIGYVPVSLLYAICGSLGFHQNAFLLTFGASIIITIGLWFVGRQFFSNSFG